MSVSAQLDGVLRGLVSSEAGLRGAAVVSNDGLLLSGQLPDEVGAASMVAAASSLIGAQHSAQVLLHGSPIQEHYLRSEHGLIGVACLPKGLRLLALAEQETKLVTMQMMMRDALETLDATLDPASA